MTCSKQWLLVCMLTLSRGMLAAEEVDFVDEYAAEYNITPAQLASLDTIKPADPADEIDYFLYRLHKYLSDDTLLIAVESDKVRIPLLISDLRLRLKNLAEVVRAEPVKYGPFMADIAQRYSSMADAVPDMTYYEAKWWRKQLLAQAMAIKEQRSKAMINGLNLDIIDAFVQVYQDLSCIIVPAAYVSRMGTLQEQIEWWWSSASPDERAMVGGRKLGYVAASAASVVFILWLIFHTPEAPGGGAGAGEPQK